MKKFILLLLITVSAWAGDLQIFVHTPGAADDGAPIDTTYNFADTVLGGNTTIVVRLKNTSSTKAYLIRTVFGADSSFKIGGSILDNCLAAGTFEDVTVSFVPSALGTASSPLQVGYAPYPASTGCPSVPPQNVQVSTLTTLNGSGIAATLNVSVSVNNAAASAINAGTQISFGQVDIGATQTATVTVQNATTATLDNPTPTLTAAVFSQPPFSLSSLASWPTKLGPGASSSFTVTFAPTQQAQINAALNLGDRSYPLVGTGVAGPGLAALLVSYTLPTGVRYAVTTATAIDFGSALTGSSQQFIFSISNPLTNFDNETISAISLTGSGFTLINVPNLPLTLKPGDSSLFSVTYAPTQAGAQSAVLNIGTLQYNLTAKATAPALNPTFQFTPQNLASSQQAQLSIQLPTAPQAPTVGTLTLSFTSAITGIADDPAIMFVTGGNRNTNVTFAPGSTTGTFAGGQNTLTFQTGTTAGTLKFTLSFTNGETYNATAQINPSLIQISSASATRQSPYLILNISAFDNTYSAGKMLFNFYDAKGDLLTPGGISVDETQDFHNYFFVNNQAGGTFALQAKFPVTGDVTTISSADFTIQNTNGQTQTQHLTF